MIVTSKTQQNWVQRYLHRMMVGEVWAIGGSQVCEEGKIVAKHLNQPLMVVPTCLSSDAFFTGNVAVRIDGHDPVYPVAPRAKEVIFDFDILKVASYRQNVSGWGDILSALSAHLTWSKKPNYDVVVAKKMKDLVDRCCAPVDEMSTHVLFDTLKKEVELCDEFGSAEPEEGLEHKVAYKLEKFAPKIMLHGELVMIGTKEILTKLGDVTYFDELCRELSVNVDSLKDRIGNGIVDKVVEEVLCTEKLQ